MNNSKRNKNVTRGSFNPPGGEIPVCSQGGVAIDANSITEDNDWDISDVHNDPEFERLGLSQNRPRRTREVPRYMKDYVEFSPKIRDNVEENEYNEENVNHDHESPNEDDGEISQMSESDQAKATAEIMRYDVRVVLDDIQHMISKDGQPRNPTNADVPIEMEESRVTTKNSSNRAKRSVKWGELKGLEAIRNKIEFLHSKIVTWKKNTFEVPRGKAGEDFVKEATRLLTLFNYRSDWESVALNLLVIFFPLMLQKPSARSKTKDHSRYLSKRLLLWSEGRLDEIISEAETIQRKLMSSVRKKESVIRGFTRLMLEGKVKQALKLVDANSEITGVHPLTPSVKAILEEKHPDAAELDQSTLADQEIPRVEEVIFEGIDGHAIQVAAKNVFGSGGPTKVDADLMKHVLCSKHFGKSGKLSLDLAEEVATATRRLCVEEVPYHYFDLLLGGRLIPLMKEDDGVRPIGIGEVLRRIMGRSVAKLLGLDIQLAGGALQTCTGVEAGIEAAIHAMAQIFEKDDCEAVLLVDADNAFNRLNRKEALNNIKQQCPPLFQFLNNTYKQPAKLHLEDGSYILSKEGATQGDPLAMPMYSISTRNIIEDLKEKVKEIAQVWFADDSSGAGELEKLKLWWDRLNVVGPKNGYHPKPSKTYLIVKSQDLFEKARVIFETDGLQEDDIKITSFGKRHVGAALGCDDFKTEFIKKKVEKWTGDVIEIANIAKEEPQAALSAYNTGLSQRWTFVQRTMKGIAPLFMPIEDAIRETLIPALIGRHVSDLERRILALPYRYGGMGIRDPVQSADGEYRASLKVTQLLADLIVRQVTDLSLLDRDKVKELKQEAKHEKEARFAMEEAAIAIQLDEKSKRLLKCAQEKGASAWLSALPLKRLGYTINKQEFRDAVALRYGWSVPEMPDYCACGKKNSVDHAMICKRGGYVHMRHNALRDTEAKFLSEVCSDVRTEPKLIPTPEDYVEGCTDPGARPDVSARGLWSSCEKTFFDVMVSHPTADSHMKKSVEQLYRDDEQLKKKKYGDRIRNVEKSSFTPLIFTTTGGMGPECTKMNKRLAEKLCNKNKESYAHVVRHIRTRLRFALLRATLVAIRGIRGSFRTDSEAELGDISFNLIPQARVA